MWGLASSDCVWFGGKLVSMRNGWEHSPAFGEIDGFSFFMTHKRAEWQELWLDGRNQTLPRSSPTTNCR